MVNIYIISPKYDVLDIDSLYTKI